MAGMELAITAGGIDPAVADRFKAVVAADAMGLMNEGTAAAYGDSLKDYRAWCRANKAPQVPASPEQLGVYIKHLTLKPAATPGGRPGPRSPRSIDRSIAAIQWLHRQQGHPRIDTVHARAYLNAYERALSEQNHPAARTKKAEGANRKAVRMMLATLDRSTLRGMRDAAVLLIGYSILGRASETSALDFSNVRVLANGSGMTVSVYRKKSKKWTETPIPRQRDVDMCPVVAFERLRDAMAGRLFLADPTRMEGKIFRAVDSQGQLTTSLGRPRKDGKPIAEGISTATVTNIVARTAKAAGLADEDVRWSSHSLRRGGAQDLRDAGGNREQIEEAGGWKTGSVAVGEYLDGRMTLDNTLLRLDDSPRNHCATCTCHAPAVVDVYADVVDAEIVN